MIMWGDKDARLNQEETIFISACVFFSSVAFVLFWNFGRGFFFLWTAALTVSTGLSRKGPELATIHPSTLYFGFAMLFNDDPLKSDAIVIRWFFDFFTVVIKLEFREVRFDGILLKAVNVREKITSSIRGNAT